MQGAPGDHRGAVDPAAGHAGRNVSTLKQSHGPTLADGDRLGYAFPLPEASQTREFIVIVACNDGFRAQSHAWLTRVLRNRWAPSLSESTSPDQAPPSSSTNSRSR